MSREKSPKLWSDFDGTAVKLVPKYDPRNWLKYPLPAMPGYNDFLRGVGQGGVEVMGIVSRRPNISPRRFATRRSIARLGITELSRASRYDHWYLRHEGSEARKGEFLAYTAAQEGVPLGFIDDKPHKIGVALVDALCAGYAADIQLGVVAHDRARTYTDRFLEEVDDRFAGVAVHEHDGRVEIGSEDRRFRVGVTLLEPYSLAAGLHFASEITRPR